MNKSTTFLLRLDLQLFSGEKTEKATPQKRRETRKKGQVAKSIEVSTALMFLSFFLFLTFYGKYLGSNIMLMFRGIFSTFLLLELSPESTQEIFMGLSINVLKTILPLLFVTYLAALLSGYIQIGFLFTTENLKFSLNKLNPIEGAKRIFSLRSIVELIKNLLKITMIAGVSIFLLKKELPMLIRLSEMSIGKIVEYLFSLITKLGLSISGLYAILGIADYMYQRFDHEKKMKMSKQDIKDEMKKTEGDPFIKGKIKEKQREMTFNRMMQEVPKADVIITNPTHYAVAISYDSNGTKAPVVVAKGVDFIAQKIKEIAKENGIITTENKPLARALYANVEIGQEIPEELFKAVAEILAYVYQLKGKY